MQVHKNPVEEIGISSTQGQEAGTIETLARLCSGFLATKGQGYEVL